MGETQEQETPSVEEMRKFLGKFIKAPKMPAHPFGLDPPFDMSEPWAANVKDTVDRGRTHFDADKIKADGWYHVGMGQYYTQKAHLDYMTLMGFNNIQDTAQMTSKGALIAGGWATNKLMNLPEQETIFSNMQTLWPLFLSALAQNSNFRDVAITAMAEIMKEMVDATATKT